MMRSIVAWSMQLRLLVLAGAAVLALFGMTQLRQMPVDVLPEFSRPYVEVQTEALGLSATEVEAMITVPLEADMLNGVPWVDEIRSESVPGLSSIVLFFEPGTEMLTARQVVQERLVGVHALPNVAKPPAMLQPVSSSNRFMAVGVTAEQRSLIELSVLSRWTLVPRLMGVPGVAQVSIWGQRKRQLQVQVDPETLRDHGVTLNQIIHTTGNALWASPLSFLDASTPGTGGWIETPSQRLGIQHLLPISTPADLARVSVEGTTLRLGQLANVVEDHQPLIGDALIDDEPALMLVIEKFPWANTATVTASVEEAVEALQLGMPGVKMDTTAFRPATYLELMIENQSAALLLAAALLMAGFLALSFDWRTALISSAAVGVSALAALSVLYLQGMTINAMVLAGLVVALVALIDDAVIDIQNIARRLAENPEGSDAALTARTIFVSALQMRRPMVYATAIVALGVAPLMLLEGIAGAFAQPIVLAYGLALLASLLTAATVTPALSLLLMGSGSRAAGSPLLQGLQRVYDGSLARAIGAPGGAFLSAAVIASALVVGGLYMSPRNAENLVPNFRERDVLITVDGRPGTSQHAMRRAAAQLSSEVRSLPGVRDVSAHVGRAVMSDRTSDINGGEVWVSLHSSLGASEYDATVAAIRESVSGYPGFDVDLDTFLSERLKDEAGNGQNLQVRVYGEDMAVLRTKAEAIRDLLGQVAGVVEPEVHYPEVHPNFEIEVDLSAAERYGLKPGDVRRAATTLLSGIEVGSLFEDQKVFDVVVWGTPAVRHSPSSVADLLIDTPAGGHVRLKDVAHTRIVSSPTAISREAVARHIDVDADVVGRDLAEVSVEITGLLRNEIDFPLEYRAEVMGRHADEVAAAGRVRAVAMAAGLGVLLLLQAAFGSWSLACFVMASLPLALVGGIAAALAFGELMSMGSLLGLLAVLTLAVRQSLALVAHYRNLEEENGGFSAELVARGTRERFAAIATTALATALAFAPFALFGNVAGLEILHAMALAVMGGLVSATLVVLLVVPSLYLGFGASAEPFQIEPEEEAA